MGARRGGGRAKLDAADEESPDGESRLVVLIAVSFRVSPPLEFLGTRPA
jgi:hypothetical protein